MPYYTVCYVTKLSNDKKESIKFASFSFCCEINYFEKLTKATDELFRIIKEYKKPNFRESITKPINMNCDYNVYIYEVEVWKNIETHNYKIKLKNKVIPKLSYPSKYLNKYLELCDQDNMNIAKLCLELYGNVITKNQIEDIKIKSLQESIELIDSSLKKINNVMYIHLFDPLNKTDEFGNKIVGFEILKDINKHYDDLGYYMKTIAGGHAANLYFFEKSYIDPLVKKFEQLLKKDELTIYSNYENKKYIFDKFIVSNQLNSEYVIYYLKDHFVIRPFGDQFGYYNQLY